MKRFIVLVVTSVALVGCGSITRGTSEPVTITSKPATAEISTSIGHRCKSPCTITVERKTSFTAYAEAPGYERGSLEIKTKVSGKGAAGFAGNIVAGGIIGMGVDAATGASLDHYPNPAEIVLTPIGSKRAVAAKPVAVRKTRKKTRAATPMS